MKLLLVEDEELLSSSIARGLRKRGYALDCAYDGKEALELYEINQYDLIILDLNLPEIDGLEVLKQIRQKDASVRILILSARSSVSDRIDGLDNGSNDYMTKPFDFAEFEARMRALLRQEVKMKETVLSRGGLQVNTALKQVFWDNRPVELTKKEYALLEYLMFYPDKVISPEELFEHVWGNEADPFSNALHFHISTLRKKLAP